MKLRKAVVLQGKIREFLIFPSDLPVKNNLGVVPEVKNGNFNWKCQEPLESNHEDASNTGKEVLSAIERVNSEQMKSFNQGRR